MLQVVGAMDRGGAETMLMNVYRAIDRQRVQFDFLTYVERECAYDQEIRKLGGRILPVSSSRSPGAIAAVLRDFGPFAAVHAHTNLGSAIPLAVAKAEGVPVRIAHSHSSVDSRTSFFGQWYGRFARKAISMSATHFVGCGDQAGRNLFGEQRWRARGALIPNSVDVASLTTLSAAPLAEDTGLRTAARVFGCVARMDPVKNHEFLIDLASRPDFPQDVIFAFVGDGRLRSHLEERTRGLEVDKRVRFLGVRSDVAALMKGMTGLLLPSHHEGFPMVLVEAQATRTPCLVSTGIPAEADLGLGLVRRLPLDQATWIEALRQDSPVLPDIEAVRSRLRARGYDSAEAARRFVEIYLATD